MHVVDAELAALGAVLVEERVLRRIIKGHRKLRGVGLQVPHEHCYSLLRDELAPLLDRDDIGVALTALPARVVVVAGDGVELAAGGPEVQSRLWRMLFHAGVHRVFDEKLARNELGPVAIRERVDRIGQTEFDEIRSILRQEDLLVPPVDDTTTYVEFVALYLELEHFAPSAVARTFSVLSDRRRVDATIALDLDAAALLAAARPSRAPATPLIAAPPPDPTLERPATVAFVDPSARRAAHRARVRGNRSRAAILAARAGELHAARTDLDELVARLARGLAGPTGASPTPPWLAGATDALAPVAQFAAGQRLLRFSAGARLLHDLQTACVVAEREVKVVDAVTWALSRGKRPIVRALPATREVRVAKHVRAALAKVATCGLNTPEQRVRLADILRQMSDQADGNVRATLRPTIEAALVEVGLQPFSLPDRVAEKKLVDELLDRAVEQGRLNLGNLRDAISKNDLKVPDLQLAELKSGDQLLRCDRILAGKLDGVYRRGEVYMRFLQKASSVLFGTRVGRFLTLYVMLPLLGSFAVVEGLQHMIGPLAHKLAGVEPQISSPASLLGGAAFLFLLLHLGPFRSGVIWVLRMIWRVIRFFLFDVPLGIWRHPLVQRVLDSPITRVIFKPAIPAGLVLLLVPRALRWPVAASVFAVVAVLVSTRLGRVVEEQVTDWLVRSGRQVTSRILPGLVKYVLEIFAKLVELFERGLYRVDEWLRFRAGQSVVTVAIKGTLGAIWFVITYFLRLYVNLFLEPTINPIKHFPVVTVAAKIILPFVPAMLTAISGPASQLMGPALGRSFAALTVIVIPGLAGFLVWELKENWKLYRATRAKVMGAQAIGHHGESLVRFLKPGFHSGTIPKLYTKLRRAAWKDDERGVLKQKEGLHHVEQAIATFTDRQLASMLNAVPAFVATDVAVQHVELGSNRVQVELICPSLEASEHDGGGPLAIRFEQQSGWLVASVRRAGWLDRLDDAQRQIFEIALAGFYKLAGVELVREQLEHVLRGADAAPLPYDIADDGLLVWPGRGYEIEALYDLRAKRLTPSLRRDPTATTPDPADSDAGASALARPAVEPAEYLLPDLGARHALFGREPLYWSVWSTAWQQIVRGEAPMSLLVGPSLLPTVSNKPASLLPAAAG